MTDDLISRQAVLDALHTQLEYPTEACAIVRAIPATDEEYADDDGDCCWNCGGEGYVANCQDEIACMYPEDGCSLCLRRCEYCNSPTTQKGSDNA